MDKAKENWMTFCTSRTQASKISPPESAEPFWPPGRLRSLWDMLKTNGQAFYYAVTVMQSARTMVETSDGADAVIPASTRANMTESLKSLLTELEILGARQTAKAARRLIEKVEDMAEPITMQAFGESAKDIDGRLTDELEDTYFFALAADKVALFEPKNPLFGQQVLERFPKAQLDIDEAGKCLALRRNKAAVFHLMLAMEEALRALATKANANLYDKHGNFDRWMVIVSNLKAAIPSLPASEQETWMEVHNLLWGVGKSWRNGTMHPADAYSDEDAETIFNSVKSFMRYLAPLV